jgi:hypothetical protein
MEMEGPKLTTAHSLRTGCEILKNQQLKGLSKWNTTMISCAAQA